MTTISKAFEALKTDLNQENSRIIKIFDRITKLFLAGAVLLGMGLFLIIMLQTGLFTVPFFDH